MRGFMHHIDLSVSDLARSAPFYDAVLGFMGYGRGRVHADGIDYDAQTGAGMSSVGIRTAHRPTPHDRYAPGLHHFAWRAESREDVDRLHEVLKRIGATILDAPADYPEYGETYYAVFFADPDGLKLEFVHFPGGDKTA